MEEKSDNSTMIIFLFLMFLFGLLIVADKTREKKVYDPWSYQYKVRIYSCVDNSSRIIYYYGDSDPYIKTFLRAVPKLVTTSKEYQNICDFEIIWRYNVREADKRKQNP